MEAEGLGGGHTSFDALYVANHQPLFYLLTDQDEG